MITSEEIEVFHNYQETKYFSIDRYSYALVEQIVVSVHESRNKYSYFMKFIHIKSSPFLCAYALITVAPI